jgi:hypothetical protein
MMHESEKFRVDSMSRLLRHVELNNRKKPQNVQSGCFGQGKVGAGKKGTSAVIFSISHVKRI